MYCRNCGQELTDGVDFCFNCGHKAGEGQAFCGKCGVGLNNERKCINCGYVVNDINKERENTTQNNNYNSQNEYQNYQGQNRYGSNSGYNNGQSTNRYGSNNVAGNGNYQGQNNYGQPQNVYNGGKSRIAAGILGILLGGLGIHRFYLGYIGLGIVQIVVSFLTCGFGSIWGFIEGILILCGAGITTDANGNQLCD